MQLSSIINVTSFASPSPYVETVEAQGAGRDGSGGEGRNGVNGLTERGPLRVVGVGAARLQLLLKFFNHVIVELDALAQGLLVSRQTLGLLALAPLRADVIVEALPPHDGGD